MSGSRGPGALDPATPVLVGVGAASAACEPAALMARATEAAAEDAGSPSLLAAVDRVAVPQGNWSAPDPGRLVAGWVGAAGAETHRYELGIPQQRLIDDAVGAVAAGRSEVALVVGGEALRWVRDRTRAGEEASETDQGDAVADVVHRREGPLLEDVEVALRLWEPVQQYAMIENALRVAEGRDLGDHRREVAELWARFNAVAATNPRAAFPAPMTAEDIATPSAANRPLAFPYNKWHASQWTVDQAAALLLCRVETARRLGIPSDRWVFPRVGLTSGHAVSLLARRRPQRWPAMGVLARAAAAHLGRPVDGIEILDVYSCFPAAVRVQQRELGLDPAGTPTVTGGMAFAGGPFNNYVLQAMVTVVEQLREAPVGTLAGVTTVSGLLTKPGLGVWAAEPGDRPPLVADLAAEAAAATEVVPVVGPDPDRRGRATVVTSTVTYDGMDPVRTVAVCDLPDGRRTVAVSEEAALAVHASSRELAGTVVELDGTGFAPA